MIAKTAAEALKILWQEGFFKKWKKLQMIIEYLAGKDHNFSASDLGVGLMRAKYLTRRGKRSNYEYIQKYPYHEEKIETKTKKKR